jgi:hypothetical protein
MDCREQAWQPAAAQLRGSMDSDHKMGDISFIFDTMTMNLCRGMCNYINDILTKGCIKEFNGSTGTPLPTTEGLLFGQDG